MPRKKSPSLTDAELRLMDILWGRGSGTVADVAQVCTPLAYSSVLTTLRVLENKGYLTHIKEGRAFIYSPVVGREEARQNAVSHLLGRFFEGSPEMLMLNLIGAGEIKPGELARIKARIEKEKP
jgi:predicted transcriptional regulator